LPARGSKERHGMVNRCMGCPSECSEYCASIDGELFDKFGGQAPVASQCDRGARCVPFASGKHGKVAHGIVDTVRLSVVAYLF
jgi:hypothetical protein